MGFSDGLKEMADAIILNFKLENPGIYKDKDGIETPIDLHVSPSENDPYTNLLDRRIKKNGYLWEVKVFNNMSVQFNKAGNTADIQIFYFKVDIIPVVTPGDTITINTEEWTVL